MRRARRRSFYPRLETMGFVILVCGFVLFTAVGHKLGLRSEDGDSLLSYGIPNCSTARAMGIAPMRRGERGYSSKLDADGDGIACEPYR